ncbi:MAG: hypothetical protein H0W70_08745, partial [Actinobacteria bacterium]|nr:hypothetical protein [Actinomycetota bacterium]
MARRLEIELTSKVDDETWTWRAAGARQPKGRLAGKLLHKGAKVGDVVRAEVEDDIEGIAVLSVLPPKTKRVEPELLEIFAPVERQPPAPSAAPPSDRKPRARAKESGDRARPDRG